jgi:hypothetical protein
VIGRARLAAVARGSPSYLDGSARAPQSTLCATPSTSLATSTPDRSPSSAWAIVPFSAWLVLAHQHEATEKQDANRTDRAVRAGDAVPNGIERAITRFGRRVLTLG